MNFKYFKIGTLIPFLIILALLLQPISDWVVAWLNTIPQISKVVPYVDSLSTLGMISIVLAIINFWGWKCIIFKWLIDVPNLNGRYVGKLSSSFQTNGQNTERDCVLEIRQTASGIHINAYTGDINTGVTSSTSSTTSEQIIKQSSGFFELFYIFSNTPNTTAVQLNNHDGTAHFIYYPDIKKLEGSYYNQRKNDGTIIVTFDSEERIGRLKR